MKFLLQLYARRETLRSCLRDAASGSGGAHPDEWLLWGGCYLAATGKTDRAFLAGVLQRLHDAQDYLSWTPQALREHSLRCRQAWMARLGLGAVAVGAGAAFARLVLGHG